MWDHLPDRSRMRQGRMPVSEGGIVRAIRHDFHDDRGAYDHHKHNHEHDGSHHDHDGGPDHHHDHLNDIEHDGTANDHDDNRRSDDHDPSAHHDHPNPDDDDHRTAHPGGHLCPGREPVCDLQRFVL